MNRPAQLLSSGFRPRLDICTFTLKEHYLNIWRNMTLMLMNLEISIQKYNYRGLQAYWARSVEMVVFWFLTP
jgi:hypothetical protein